MTLTKGQVNDLTSEQQEALAAIELKELKRRERLLDLARVRRHPWFSLLALALMPTLVMVPIFLSGRLSLILYIFLIAECLWFVIQGELKSTNRRIDALIKLLEMDKKRPDEVAKMKETLPQVPVPAIDPDARYRPQSL